jgi:RNA polymerase sigma-70 factor (ECF subfamily)
MSEGEQPGEVELVQRFKELHDRESLGLLFDRHARRLYALTHRILRDRARAEDCVQETFRHALEEIHRFDETRTDVSFGGWLATIAKHVCLDELRRARTRGSYAREIAHQPSGELSGEDAVLLGEVREELAQLEPAYRMCWLLFHVDGYRYKEIIRLTGYSYEQVKTFIQTAQRRIERRFYGTASKRSGTAG